MQNTLLFNTYHCKSRTKRLELFVVDLLSLFLLLVFSVQIHISADDITDYFKASFVYFGMKCGDNKKGLMLSWLPVRDYHCERGMTSHMSL